MLTDFLSCPIMDEYRNTIDSIVNIIGSRVPVLYGYQGQGYFVKWFLDKYCTPYEWTIVDDRDYIFDCQVLKPIELALGLIDINNTVLLICKELTSHVAEQIALMGYDISNREQVINVYDLFDAHTAFFSWLEHTKRLDLVKGKNIYNKLSYFRNYTSITERAVVNVEESFPKGLSVLDIGAGKGAAAIYFACCGRTVGLAEYDSELIEISKNNFAKLCLSGRWYSGDASLLGIELDAWDCFCLYNPFVGEPFKIFIDSLIASVARNRRTIYVAYGNPIEAFYLFKVGFELKKRILTDSSCRYWLLFEYSE